MFSATYLCLWIRKTAATRRREKGRSSLTLICGHGSEARRNGEKEGPQEGDEREAKTSFFLHGDFLRLSKVKKEKNGTIFPFSSAFSFVLHLRSTNHQPSTINHQSSIINHQPSTINHQPSIRSNQTHCFVDHDFNR